MGKYKVEISGIDTNNLEKLKQVEIRTLFERFHSGDETAREELINGNLRLVLSVLKKFYNKEMNLDDLFQVGCMGLIKAIDNFDLSYDVMFSTYAVPMILGEIKRYIRDNNSIRISRSLKDLAYKILNYKEVYYSKNGREPSTLEIALSFDVSEYDIYNALQAMKEPVSMYEPVYNDGGDTIYLFDQIVDTSSDVDFSDKIAVENAIEQLESREKFILDQRFVIGKSQMEIADELLISQAQVSRLEKKAIKQLKKELK